MDIEGSLFDDNERQRPQKDGLNVLSVGDLHCEAGGYLPDVQVAYMTWGELNPSKSNAVLICHALSGDANAAAWWSNLIGPGKALDPQDWYIIGTNDLGGCQGTTGPTSFDQDGNPWGSRFPIITIYDMAEVQSRLLTKLGIERLALVCGGSMGGMNSLAWATRYPDRVAKAWLTASCAAHSPMQIAFNEIGRQAIMRDPKWRGGDYPLDDPPTDGLAVARMVGHLSYLSEPAFQSKFGRGLQDKDKFDFKHGIEFQVESYLSYQADKFTGRFDPNSYLALTKAIDYFEATSLESATCDFLLTSFESDWLYLPEQSEALHQMALDCGLNSRHVRIDLPYGHDAFLLDGHYQAEALQQFLGEKA